MGFHFEFRKKNLSFFQNRLVINSHAIKYRRQCCCEINDSSITARSSKLTNVVPLLFETFINLLLEVGHKMTSRHNDSWDKRHKNKNEQDQIKKKVFGKKRQVNRKIHHGFYIRDLFANGGRQPQINRNESSWCETKKNEQKQKLGRTNDESNWDLNVTFLTSSKNCELRDWW